MHRYPGRPDAAVHKLLMTAIFIFMALLTPPSAAGNRQDPLLAAVAGKLIEDGFDSHAVQNLYSHPEVAFTPEGVSVFFIYRESRLDYDQFTVDKHIALAKAYLARHRAAFARAESLYGVDREVIAAILLVETRLGGYVGNLSTLNTLSTMAALEAPRARAALWKHITRGRKISRKLFEKKAARKAAWAYRELKAFLRYTARENLDPASIRGSFAGALGICQFMPTSIMRYARDGDNDGRIDLFDHADAIASVGGYLNAFGWHRGISRDRAAKVIYRYNRSGYYVRTVLKIADLLKQ